jgi:quercetin dioxygenase-like cupin family protein
MNVKHTSDIDAKEVVKGINTSMQVLISAHEAPHFAMRRFIMQKGGGMPRHTNTVEHEQYVLGGHARIGIGDETFEVQKGDIVFIPEGVPHWYQNLGDEPFEFLCLIPNKTDTITVLDEPPAC